MGASRRVNVKNYGPSKSEATSCRAIQPLKKEVCGEAAVYQVTFSDGEKVHVCQPCALYLKEVARGCGYNLSVKTLEDTPPASGNSRPSSGG